MAAMGMTVPRLGDRDADGLTCLSADVRGRGAAFAFVGRTGGVSGGAHASLNVGGRCGDDPRAVAENRRRALRAIGADGFGEPLVPNQVHGSRVVSVTARDGLGAARADAEGGCDAVVCSEAGVAVLMEFADCVPVVLVAPGAFAVVHAGWRGALARVAGLAALELARVAGCGTSALWAYVGPHVGPASYEVSGELLGRFVREFGPGVGTGGSRLDLGAAVAAALADAGVQEGAVVDCGVDTATATDRWFSHRASGGVCGRHAAVAWLPGAARD